MNKKCKNNSIKNLIGQRLSKEYGAVGLTAYPILTIPTRRILY